MKSAGVFSGMARELQRTAIRPPVIELEPERVKRAEREADRLIAALIEREGGLLHAPRLALFVSTEFRRVAVAAFSNESPKAAIERLCVVLNILTEYTASEAPEAVSLRAMSRAFVPAADLIEQAARGIERRGRVGARSPGGRWHADVFNPEKIPELARNGGLVFALKALAHALRSAPLALRSAPLSQVAAAPISAVPGVSLSHLPKSAPGLHSAPRKAIAGHMARNLHAAMPSGVADPFATITALLRLIGVETNRHKVALAIKSRAE